MIKFLIEPGSTSTHEVTAHSMALFYLEICIHGVPVALDKRHVCVEADGVSLGIGADAVSITKSAIQLRGWGVAPCDLTASAHLMALKPHLPKLCRLLAEKLLFPLRPPPGTIDLVSGGLVTQPPHEIKFGFVDATVKVREETVVMGSRILFNCFAVRRHPTAKTLGAAGRLTVCLSEDPACYRKDLLVFNSMGWITNGVDAMRRSHSDATIKAAFLNLAYNLLAQDATPPSAEACCAVATTK